MAGLQFQRTLITKTKAVRDQDHVSYIYYCNSQIPPRQQSVSEYLPALTQSIKVLERAGASIIVFACDSAYASLPTLQHSTKARLLNLPALTTKWISTRFKPCRLGLLAAPATIASGLYTKPLQRYGFTLITPSRSVQKSYVEKSIYHPRKGIKAGNYGKYPQKLLQFAIRSLEKQKVRGIILGCTDIPIVRLTSRVPLIDPASIIAEIVIRLSGKRLT